MAKKWPETVLEQLFKSNIHFRSVFMIGGIQKLRGKDDVHDYPKKLDHAHLSNKL